MQDFPKMPHFHFYKPRVDVNTQFCQFFQKLHEIERIWMPGKGAFAPNPDLLMEGIEFFNETIQIWLIKFPLNLQSKTDF